MAGKEAKRHADVIQGIDKFQANVLTAHVCLHPFAHPLVSNSEASRSRCLAVPSITHHLALPRALRQLLPLSPFLRGAPSHRDGLQRLSPSRMLQHEQRRSQMRKTYSTPAGDTSADTETWFGLGSQPGGSPRKGQTTATQGSVGSNLTSTHQ